MLRGGEQLHDAFNAADMRRCHDVQNAHSRAARQASVSA
jgi:hypothetical protein